MSLKPFVPFSISSMDSLGQGVSKLSDKVTFIPKTTVGDEGEAEIFSEKKGVAFGRVKSLVKKSAERIEPDCRHFNQCPSCHYLHVPYERELFYKKEAYNKLFRKLPLPDVEVISAPIRIGYRNRIQLHYSLKSKLIGMKDPSTFQIIPIPECLIGVPEVLTELKRLYSNQTWLREAPSAPMEGHLEIYWHNNSLQVNWNKAYASGGFTQVFESMNQKMKELLRVGWQEHKSFSVLDLFGGNGNLSSVTNYSSRLCVDSYPHEIGADFFNQNLYDKNALSNIKKELNKRNIKLSHIILDPPRSGMKDLGLWLDQLKPKYVAYVSCDPHTLARDLQSVQGYQYTKSILMDFFPSTFHFESMIFLERND